SDSRWIQVSPAAETSETRGCGRASTTRPDGRVLRRLGMLGIGTEGIFEHRRLHALDSTLAAISLDLGERAARPLPEAGVDRGPLSRDRRRALRARVLTSPAGAVLRTRVVPTGAI